MTRLTSEDIADFVRSWPTLEKSLKDLTRLNLANLVCLALDLPFGTAQKFLSAQTVAVVPDTSGEGIIPGFSEALVYISQYLGAKAFITDPDELGFKQARLSGATITLSSSDDLFVAKNLTTNRISENRAATGKGFAQILHQMSYSTGNRILVLGAGPVGIAAAKRLAALRLRVVVYDVSAEKKFHCANTVAGVEIWTSDHGRMPFDFSLMVEATNAGILWPPEEFRMGTSIAAAGMPLSFLPADHYNLWHDPLATGVAIMLVEASMPQDRSVNAYYLK